MNISEAVYFHTTAKHDFDGISNSIQQLPNKIEKEFKSLKNDLDYKFNIILPQIKEYDMLSLSILGDINHNIHRIITLLNNTSHIYK